MSSMRPTSKFAPGANVASDDDDDEEAALDAEQVEREERRLGYKNVRLTKPARAPRDERKGDDGLIFTERDLRHPNGEVVVVKGRVVRVYPTPRVMEAIGAGLLEEVRLDPTPEPPSVAEVLEQTRREQAAQAQAAAATPAPATPAPASASASSAPAQEQAKTAKTPRAGAAARTSRSAR